MASIKCGNCKGTHASVAEVRSCYAGGSVLANLPGEGWGPNSSRHVFDGGEAIESATSPEITEGFWVLGEDVYKVQRAVHGSGQLYAKRLDVSVSGDPGDPDTSASFSYAPGAIRTLQNSARVEKLTLERAKELGHLYGVCMRCGRTLTDENSIEAGIGPVCAGKGF